MIRSSDYQMEGSVSDLRSEIDRIADQLCQSVSGDLNFHVIVDRPDETLDKLAMLMNFVIEGARRSLSELQIQNQKLAEVDQMKSAFLANVSHELRTPLTLILAPLRKILDESGPESVPEKIRGDLQRVLRNSERLHRLVNDLLDLSKLEAHQMQVHSSAIHPARFLESLVQDVLPLAESKQIAIASEFEWGETNIITDPALLEKILLNLISNALKFTPAKGQVSIRLRKAGSSVQFDIADTGPGIPPEQRSYLFQRFQRLESEATLITEGTGLGLALVQQFTRLLNGEVELENPPEGGSVFRILLPFEPASAAPEQRMPRFSQSLVTAEELMTIPAASWSGTKPLLLVVEDHIDMALLIQQITDVDFNVVFARNGAQALDSLRRHRVDLILSDLTMPIMGGLELLKQVKAHQDWQYIPFVLLTAQTAPKGMSEGLNEGADDYIAKPFDSVELRSRLRSSLRTRKLYLELQRKNDQLSQAEHGLQLQVRERTSQLQIQTEKAVAANRAKDQFLANMSHEIRTPLTAVLGFSELLLETSHPESDEGRFLGSIHRNAKHLFRLVQEMLDFSKIEAGRLELEMESFSIREIIQDVTESFEPRVREQDLWLRMHGMNHLPATGISDPLRVRQILINVIGNAVKFTEKGGIDLYISKSDTLKNILQVAVQDTGPGISEGTKSELFTPFFQGDMSMSRKLGGTGLGLALSRELARALGGDLYLASTQSPGGSRFIFEIPYPP